MIDLHALKEIFIDRMRFYVEQMSQQRQHPLYEDDEDLFGEEVKSDPYHTPKNIAKKIAESGAAAAGNEQK